jgi:hypothetical protein
MRERNTVLPDESVPVGAGAGSASARRAARLSRLRRFGGTEGNEILTSATAVVLTVLLLAEGVTILRIGGLVGPHMFVGMVLIPPVALKLGSTGYRFARYYGGSRAYREKGPPLLPLRLLAPVLVAMTVAVLATGVVLMAIGHRSRELLFFHKLTFIAWGIVFAVHFLAYLPRMLRSLADDWRTARRRSVPGAGVRGLLVAASIGAGVALALSVLSLINGWQRPPHRLHEGSTTPPPSAAVRLPA